MSEFVATRRWRGALLCSLLVHLGALVHLFVRPAPMPSPVPPTGALPTALTGTTFEFAETEVVSEAVQAPAAPSASGSPAVPPAAAPVAADSPSPDKPASSREPAKAEPAEADSAQGEPGDDAATKPRKPAAASPPTPRQRPAASEEPSAGEQVARSESGSTAPAGAPPGGTYGQAGPTQGSPQFYSAFIRTIPLAMKLDPAWQQVARGYQAHALVEARFEPDGRLAALTVLHGDPSGPLGRAARKNEVFLRSRSFGSPGAAPLTLALSLRVSDGPAPSPKEDDDKVVEIGQTFADAQHLIPSGAYFVYGSGRRVELHVESMPMAAP